MIFNLDDIVEESHIEEEYENDYYTEDYDVCDLNSYCDAILENKADIKLNDSMKRYADRMSGNHTTGKFMHDSMYKYGDSYTKDMKTTKDFKERNKLVNKNTKALSKTEKDFDKKREKNVKRASKGKEIKKDVRHLESTIYDDVNDLFNFETV